MPTYKSQKPNVTVIIPVFNGEKYLQNSLDSIYSQSFENYEIIAVDDGSTDNTPGILKENAASHRNLGIITQPNHGQGYARNRALDKSRGKYVLFLDSDDRLAPEALEKCLRRAEADGSDVVNYNWQMLERNSDGTETLNAFNAEVFANKTELVGDACEMFLEKHNYFCWDSLYRREFLDDHNIRFGEGYIYEDNEFIVAVASYAQKISIINEPLYVLRYNVQSSTHTQHKTDKHYKDFMGAMEASIQVFEPRTAHSSFYLAAYFLEKFIIYYQTRVPRALHRQYIRDFVDTMHTLSITPPMGKNYKFLRTCLARGVFVRKRYSLFFAALQYKTKVLPVGQKLTGYLHKAQQK